MTLALRVRDLVHGLHRRLAGTEMGERTTTVLRALTWMGPAAVVSRLASGVTTLLVMRHLGPSSYGHASLALAATAWLQVPLFLGLPSAILNAVPRAPESERGAWARTGALLMTLAGVAVLLAGALLRHPLASALGMGTAEVTFALAWCAGYLAYSVAITLLTALERFRERALAELAFAAGYAMLALILWLGGRLTWQSSLLALSGGYALAGLACFLTGRVPRPALDSGTTARALSLARVAAIAIASSVALALLNATGRQIMNRHFALNDVGLLAAYQGGSLQFANYAQAILIPVFLPIAARTPDRPALFAKVARLLIPITAAGTVAYAGLLVAWILLLGRQYPLDAAATAAFAGAAALTTSFAFVIWLAGSGGAGGVATSALLWLLCGVVSLTGSLVLIPLLGLAGAGLAVAIGNLGGILAIFLPPVRRWSGLAAAAPDAGR